MGQPGECESESRKTARLFTSVDVFYDSKTFKGEILSLTYHGNPRVYVLNIESKQLAKYLYHRIIVNQDIQKECEAILYPEQGRDEEEITLKRGFVNWYDAHDKGDPEVSIIFDYSSWLDVCILRTAHLKDAEDFGSEIVNQIKEREQKRPRLRRIRLLLEED